MIHFGLILVKGVRSVSRWIFLHVDIWLFQHRCAAFASFKVKGQRLSLWGSVSVLSVLSIDLFVLLPKPHYLYYRSLIINLCSPPSILCWLFWVFCISINTLESVCWNSWNNLLTFWLMFIYLKTPICEVVWQWQIILIRGKVSKFWLFVKGKCATHLYIWKFFFSSLLWDNKSLCNTSDFHDNFLPH